MLTSHEGYEKQPFVPVSPDSAQCLIGWKDIFGAVGQRIQPGKFVICLECYPGALVSEICAAAEALLEPQLLIRAESLYRAEDDLDKWLDPLITDDPVFGRMNGVEVREFLDPELLGAARLAIQRASGLVVIVGTGAVEVAQAYNLLVYADMARWEIQQRQRRNEIRSLGVNCRTESPAAKYKRGFFVDWRAADRLKTRLYDRINFLLDTNDTGSPKMISGEAFRLGLQAAVRRPFRVVPFFDPGPWGGEWMREKFQLSADAPNFAWCFDCVPEENSLLLGFGSRRVEVPAINLVLRHTRELLGDAVFGMYGAEFPIRFDLLDTWRGGNLSLQVHPTLQYIREKFGMSYTQDESYYLLDAAEGASVYLGLKEGVDKEKMFSDLRSAQNGGPAFEAERYVNRWPARKHDHFLIPAGTIHCSGANSVVLEISATPYIFTFKLWDWARLGLNGQPRPIHLDHGMANIQWNRTEPWVRRELINRVETIAATAEWSEERTGLHSSEFIETRRHWFKGPVPHDTDGKVNVLNLVEGTAAVVESPHQAFTPFAVHYAETFIIPAAVGPYTIQPLGPERCATIKAIPRA